MIKEKANNKLYNMYSRGKGYDSTVVDKIYAHFEKELEEQKEKILKTVKEYCDERVKELDKYSYYTYKQIGRVEGQVQVYSEITDFLNTL